MSCVFIFLLSVLITTKVNGDKPNIIFIVADDLGWNDVGFHGSGQIPTPNIDSLAYSGIILNNYYVAPICSPSRSAIMTGKHPIHTGLHHDVIYTGSPYGLALDEVTLPNHLNTLGYSSRMVGKWHLGFYQKEYTPTYRGFKSFFGYYAGNGDYYNHIHSHPNQGIWGYDMRNNMEVAKNCIGNYSTDMFTSAAVDVISKHDVAADGPLFLYVAHQATHSATTSIQAPPETIQLFDYIKDEDRREFAGMLTHLDYSVGDIVSALSENKMLDNSIIVFTTDNGGPAGGFDWNFASNWPLRGVKDTLYEGGVRGASFIWSPLLQQTKRVSSQMMHISDWLPTLYTAAGGAESDLGDIDGVSLWKALSEDTASPREEVLHNIDCAIPNAAYTFGDYKILQGDSYKGTWDGWYGPSGRDFEDLTDETSEAKYKSTLQSLWEQSPAYNILTGLNMLSVGDMAKNRQAAELKCGPKPEKVTCKPFESPCLVNIKLDPCEYINLAEEKPHVLKMMQDRLEAINLTVVPPRNKPFDYASDPKLHDYVWTSWIESEVNLD